MVNAAGLETRMPDTKEIAEVANCFAGTAIDIFSRFDIKAEFNKKAMGDAAAGKGCRIASVISVIGPNMSGTITIMMKEPCFVRVIPIISYGLAKGEIDDEMAQSVLAETSNMIAGNAGIKLESKGIEGYNVSTPQVITGNNIVASSMTLSSVHTVAMPFNIKVGADSFENELFLVLAFKVRFSLSGAKKTD